MLNQFAQTITSFLLSEKVINESEKEIYLYGTEQVLVNGITFLAVGVIASITGIWIETIFFMIGLIPIRIKAGGFHASTPIRCNLLTFTVYITNMILIVQIRHFINMRIIYVLAGFVFSSIYVFAPVDHKNMKLENENRDRAKNQSRIVGIIVTVSSIGLTLVNLEIATSIIMGAVTASVSLIIGSIIGNCETNN